MLRTRRHAVLLLCSALAGTLCYAPAAAHADEVRSLSPRGLHVAANGAVTLYVSFRSGRDRSVASVAPHKLRVEFDGTPLSGALKARSPGAGDLALLLAVDVSGTMRKVMPQIQRGLRPLGALMKRTGAQVAVGAIGESWRVTRDFTAETAAVRAAVEALQATAATTALFESIHLGIGQLHQRGADLPPRRLMIVVSDAYNEKQGRTADECVAAARKALVQVHSLIYLTQRSAVALSRKGELEKISRDSGGTTVTVSGAKELRRGLRALMDDLLLERVVTIPAQQLVRDGREHTLTLRYDRVSTSVQYQAPLLAAGVKAPTAGREATPAAGERGRAARRGSPTSGAALPAKTPRTRAAPKTLPRAPQGRDRALLLTRLHDPVVLGVIGGGVLVLLFVVILALLLRRRARRRQAEAPLHQPEHQATSPPAATRPAPSSPPAPLQKDGERASQVIIAPAGAYDDAESRARPTMRVNNLSTERARKASQVSTLPTAGTITQLRDVHGLVASTPFKLSSAGARIGSGLSNEIVLDSPTVSSRHAEIVTTPTGFALRDCGSTQGTFLDHAPVGAQPLPLQPGSRIKVGLVTLVCEG